MSPGIHPFIIFTFCTSFVVQTVKIMWLHNSEAGISCVMSCTLHQFCDGKCKNNIGKQAYQYNVTIQLYLRWCKVWVAWNCLFISLKIDHD